jgi:hypothetical protein
MRWVVLTVLGLTSLTACQVTAKDVRPTCDLWGELKDSVEAGKPHVAFAADAVLRAAEESDIPRLADLAADVRSKFSRWLATDAEAGRPFSPELVKAIDAFESYCANRGAPVRAAAGLTSEGKSPAGAT